MATDKYAIKRPIVVKTLMKAEIVKEKRKKVNHLWSEVSG